jgi:ADP-ribose pyrophosphatase YjhB (NUDIX family)
VIDSLKEKGIPVEILFMDASDQVLIKRYKETRRVHPMNQPGDMLESGIEREREVLKEIKSRADYIIDSSSLLTRELKEELGVEVEILARIGVVSDYYNLIHRHNINHYYLCRVIAFGGKCLTEDEVDKYHLSTLTLNYEAAVAAYEKCACTRLGRLIANRELPVLKQVKALMKCFNVNAFENRRDTDDTTIPTEIQN